MMSGIKSKPKCFGAIYNEEFEGQENCDVCEWVWMCLDEDDKNV